MKKFMYCAALLLTFSSVFAGGNQSLPKKQPPFLDGCYKRITKQHIQYIKIISHYYGQKPGFSVTQMDFERDKSIGEILTATNFQYFYNDYFYSQGKGRPFFEGSKIFVEKHCYYLNPEGQLIDEYSDISNITLLIDPGSQGEILTFNLVENADELKQIETLFQDTRVKHERKKAELNLEKELARRRQQRRSELKAIMRQREFIANEDL